MIDQVETPSKHSVRINTHYLKVNANLCMAANWGSEMQIATTRVRCAAHNRTWHFIKRRLVMAAHSLSWLWQVLE